MKAWLKEFRLGALAGLNAGINARLNGGNSKERTGRERFVIRSALTYGQMTIGVVDIINHFSGGSQSDLAFAAVFLAGRWNHLGFGEWSHWEGKYQKALNEAHLEALPEEQELACQPAMTHKTLAPAGQSNYIIPLIRGRRRSGSSRKCRPGDYFSTH